LHSVNIRDKTGLKTIIFLSHCFKGGESQFVLKQCMVILPW